MTYSLIKEEGSILISTAFYILALLAIVYAFNFHISHSIKNYQYESLTRNHREKAIQKTVENVVNENNGSKSTYCNNPTEKSSANQRLLCSDNNQDFKQLEKTFNLKLKDKLYPVIPYERLLGLADNINLLCPKSIPYQSIDDKIKVSRTCKNIPDIQKDVLDKNIFLIGNLEIENISVEKLNIEKRNRTYSFDRFLSIIGNIKVNSIQLKENLVIYSPFDIKINSIKSIGQHSITFISTLGVVDVKDVDVNTKIQIYSSKINEDKINGYANKNGNKLQIENLKIRVDGILPNLD